MPKYISSAYYRINRIDTGPEARQKVSIIKAMPSLMQPEILEGCDGKNGHIPRTVAVCDRCSLTQSRSQLTTRVSIASENARTAIV